MAKGKEKPKQNVISICFPDAILHQRTQLKEWAEAAGMSTSKYALIILQKHINEGKPLRLTGG